MKDELNVQDKSGAVLAAALTVHEPAAAEGHFTVECYDAEGRLKWSDTIDNLVVTVGKNLALDTYLSGSAYTVTGPFMGLVSNVGFSAYAVTDTMLSHPGWTEAGAINAPTYSAPRKTVSWTPASLGTKTSTTTVFGITGSGTVKGCFIVFGSGATSTIDSTGGTLYSAGNFTGGDKIVANSDTLNVTYATSL